MGGKRYIIRRILGLLITAGISLAFPDPFAGTQRSFLMSSHPLGGKDQLSKGRAVYIPSHTFKTIPSEEIDLDLMEGKTAYTLLDSTLFKEITKRSVFASVESLKEIHKKKCNAIVNNLTKKNAAINTSKFNDETIHDLCFQVLELPPAENSYKTIFNGEYDYVIAVQNMLTRSHSYKKAFGAVYNTQIYEINLSLIHIGSNKVVFEIIAFESSRSASATRQTFESMVNNVLDTYLENQGKLIQNYEVQAEDEDEDEDEEVQEVME